MRLISAPSVTDVTIRSAIYFIPCIRGTATHYSHGLGISLYAHHLETKLEGIRCLNSDRSFDFFVFLILVYVEVRGENAGSTNETHFGIDRHVGDANMPMSTPQKKGTMALRMSPSSSNSQMKFCFWWWHFGHLQIAADSSIQSNSW